MKRRCVFLDRDGVINHAAPPGEYIQNWSEFRLLPNIVDWIRLFNALDLLVIVITNQRGVALGRMSLSDVDEIHNKLVTELAHMGGRIDDIYCCPHALESCDCRKPKPGLVFRAREKWNIELRESLVIGDSDIDAELAVACGTRFVRVSEGKIA